MANSFIHPYRDHEGVYRAMIRIIKEICDCVEKEDYTRLSIRPWVYEGKILKYNLLAQLQILKRIDSYKHYGWRSNLDYLDTVVKSFPNSHDRHQLVSQEEGQYATEWMSI